MSLKLKEVMKIYPFSRCRLVAGKEGRERFVESANIQEVPHVERWLHGKEILFSSGYAFDGSAEKGCTLIQKLNYLGATALAIKPGQYFQQIPKEMIECADELGFPLFEVPEDLPYMDCIIPIFERITSEQLYIMKRITSVHEELMRTMIENQGLNGICKALQNLIQNSVFILSPQGLIIASSEQDEDTAEILMDCFAEQYCTPAGRLKLKKNKSNQLEIGNNHSIVCVPIYIHKEHMAYLVLDTAGLIIEESDLMAFEQAGSIIAIELMKEKELLHKERTMKEQLLEDILFQRYSDVKMILRRENHLKLDISRQYCIFVIDAKAFETYITETLHNISEEKVQEIKNDIQEIIRNGIEENFSQFLLCPDSVGMTGMLKIGGEKDLEKCRNVLRSVIRGLEKKYMYLKFSAGISAKKNKILQAVEALEEAQVAMRAGKNMNRNFSDSPVCFFSELGCLRFLGELSKTGSMRDFYEEYMKPLMEFDRENEAELVKTLEYYFESNNNYRKTADRLFIHKNTVIYRIRQIENLLNVDISDPHVAFNLQLCLQLRYIL